MCCYERDQISTVEICRADKVTKKQLLLMFYEKEIENKKKTKFHQKKVDRDSKDPESTSDGGKDGKNKKCRSCGRSCSINDVRKSTDFYVAQTKSKTILGLKSRRDVMLVKIMNELNEKSAGKNTDEGNQNIIEEIVKRIKGKKGDDLKQEILKLYPEVFTGLEGLEPLHHMQLGENSSPVIHAPRKIPVSLRSTLKKELDGMEAAGVIEKVEEPTEWVNSLVVIENPDGSL